MGRGQRENDMVEIAKRSLPGLMFEGCGREKELLSKRLQGK